MRAWIWPVALALAGWSQCSSAESAADMASFCDPYRQAVITGRTVDGSGVLNVPAASVNSNFCWGAFAMFQGLLVVTPYGRDEHPYLLVCAPPTSSRLELVKIFLRYMDEHPETGHEDFAKLLLRVMWKTFPCRAT